MSQILAKQGADKPDSNITFPVVRVARRAPAGRTSAKSPLTVTINLPRTSLQDLNDYGRICTTACFPDAASTNLAHAGIGQEDEKGRSLRPSGGTVIRKSQVL